MPKKPVDTPITDKEIRFAQLLLAGELTSEQAAEAAGIKPSTADYVRSKPRVKAFMEAHRAAVAADLAKHESKLLVKLNVNREWIIQSYAELANLPRTNENGKVIIAALDSLRDMLGFSGAKSPQPYELDERPVPRARWMDKDKIESAPPN